MPKQTFMVNVRHTELVCAGAQTNQ